MTANEFRKIALSLPEATESAHMGHPDFRVGEKIFATLGHAAGYAMAKLTPDLQEAFVHAAPAVFGPVTGGWGRQGATTVNLKHCTKAIARDVLVAAWRLRAPKRLVSQFDGE